MSVITISAPAADEFIPYFGRYISLVEHDDALPALRAQIGETMRLLTPLSEAKAAHRYATGKWSIKQVVGHLSDAERVFSYRALRIGRGDQTPIPGFEENAYADAAGSDARTLGDLLEEYRAVRAATIALFAGFESAALQYRGTANGATISVRAIGWIIAGHELHHRGVLRDRYGVGA